MKTIERIANVVSGLWAANRADMGTDHDGSEITLALRRKGK